MKSSTTIGLTMILAARVLAGPPEVDGQWAGPYHLQQISAWAAAQNPPVTLKEITHAAVVGHNSVLFWCNRPTIDTASTFSSTPTFLWNPSSPSNVTTIMVPNAANGKEDLFCSGHTFDSNGDLWVFGGTDLTYSGGNLGHRNVHKYSRVGQTWSVHPFLMSTERWYPNAFLMEDSTLRVLGHESLPTFPTQNPSTATITELHEERLPNGSWLRHENQRLVDLCGAGALLNIGEYPRGHVLAKTGDWFHKETNGPLFVRLLNLDVECSLGEPDRWTVRDVPGATPHTEGNSIHYVTFPNGPFPAADPRDTIYAIAGTQHATPFTTEYVEKIIDPNTASTWVDIADLAWPRVDANTVIAADGSMIVIGGQNQNPSPAEAILIPEMRRPDELPLGTPSYSWKQLAPQAQERRYHSVAGLLPDGRIFSAGGDGAGSAPHSVEIYSPPYLFKGPRPVVSGVASNWPYSGVLQSFTVNTRPGVGISHVGLIAMGSITHGFDSGQRYVEITIDSPGVGPMINIVPTGQLNNQIAPPGYYMLFVIDQYGVPSEAQVVKVG